MPNFSLRGALPGAALVVAMGTLASPVRAQAQQRPEGFDVERFYPSSPGGGWFVMDALDMHGGLGGAMALTGGYEKAPLRVTDGTQHLAVVSDRAFVGFGFAATYDRWRVSLQMNAPIVTEGQGGTAGGYTFVPTVQDPGKNPDTLSDARIGLDARLLGEASAPFRLGASLQLFVPNGERVTTDLDPRPGQAVYDSDGTYRAMVRGLAAGDVGTFTYAGQLGVHVRPLDDAPIPGSPQGTELLFGAAAGAKVLLARQTALVVGPEVFGATSFRSFFGSGGTAVEGMLSGRLEGTADDAPQLRFKVGAGAGLDPRFGAPQWRVLVGVEIFDHHAPRAPAPP